MRVEEATRARRSMLGPIRAPQKKKLAVSKGILGRPLPRKTFESIRSAEEWAQKYADDCCHFHQRWEAEPVGGGLHAIGVYSQNTTQFSHWAE